MKKAISALLLGAMLITTGCQGGTNTTTAAAGGAGGAAQTKEVTVKGHEEGLKVKVTATADKIEKVEVVENKETPDIAKDALTKVPADIVTNNKVSVEGVSGATETSNAIKAAVEQAIGEMGFDIGKFR